MNQTPSSPTLPDLDARLAAYRKRQAEEDARRRHPRFIIPGSVIEFSGRVFNDLVAAILISIAFGATIDSVFGSWPWGFLGMFLLGAAAAVRNVYQTASRMAERETKDAAASAQPITERG
jgi:F0F1-type ATP synthase assembly protein I